jgi:sugar lactone lactonase YvrE
MNTKWKQNGFTIAGGNGYGNQLNQLAHPHGFYVDDDDQCIYIPDTDNHRVVKWKYDAKIGQVVAGGNGQGSRMDQLNFPKGVIVDKKTDSFIICDQENRRVVRWPRRSGTNGDTIISDILCFGLAMNNNGDLYVSDCEQHAVKRWKIGQTHGIIVAGGNGKGDHLNQLNDPRFIFVDQDHSVYISDGANNRVMKWLKGAKEGIVVAGGKGPGNSLAQLSFPQGVVVDHLSNVYVADPGNHRIMLWSKGSSDGRIIVGGNGQGQQPDQFGITSGLSLDRQCNLYVVDFLYHRVQKFDIDLN